jgi:hypothetical protein
MEEDCLEIGVRPVAGTLISFDFVTRGMLQNKIE